MKSIVFSVVASVGLALTSIMVGFAQERIDAISQNALAGNWSGEVDWAVDNTKKQAAVSSEVAANGKLDIVFSFETCAISGSEIQRYANGTTAFNVTEDNCGTNATVMTLVPVSSSKLGMMIMSEADLVGTGHLSSETSQLVLPGKKPVDPVYDVSRSAVLPPSLDEYYMITHSGAVYQVQQDEKQVQLIIVARDQWMEDEGSVVGNVYARGQYHSLTGQLWLEQRVVVLPDLREAYRHCGIMFGYRNRFRLEPVDARENVPLATRIYTNRPIDKQYCAIPRTSRTSCRVVACDEHRPFGGKDEIILKDRDVALALGERSKREYVPEQTFAEAYEDVRNNPGRTRTIRESSPGYFERGGACGPLTCEEEDTLNFILQEYW